MHSGNAFVENLLLAKKGLIYQNSPYKIALQQYYKLDFSGKIKL